MDRRTRATPCSFRLSGLTSRAANMICEHSLCNWWVLDKRTGARGYVFQLVLAASISA
jgi:hypothetical protein